MLPNTSSASTRIGIGDAKFAPAGRSRVARRWPAKCNCVAGSKLKVKTTLLPTEPASSVAKTSIVFKPMVV